MPRGPGTGVGMVQDLCERLELLLEQGDPPRRLGTDRGVWIVEDPFERGKADLVGGDPDAGEGVDRPEPDLAIGALEPHGHAP